MADTHRTGLAPRQLAIAFLAVSGIFVLGTLGYQLLSDGRWSLLDSAYMTAITITTVGYREVVPVENDPVLRVYTIFLIFLGTGSMLYMLSNVTAILVEGRLNLFFRRRRMEREIERIEGHYVVCGVGRNGEFAATQLIAGGYAVVLVDYEEAAIQAFLEASPRRVPYVVGDATEDAVLTRAGVQRAKGLIAALPSDQHNLYLILSARELSPGLRIVSKLEEPGARRKLVQVGADAVVSPTAMGGYRMFAEMVRPHATDFMDFALLKGDEGLGIDEVGIKSGAFLDGRTLADSGIRARTDALVVGVREPDGAAFRYNPKPEFVLRAGMTLIVLGPRASLSALHEMAGSGLR
jgi:voltage-gated potassium channel